MSLTDIMLFGEVINGGTGGKNGICNAAFGTNLVENDGIVKISDKVLKPTELHGGAFCFATEIKNIANISVTSAVWLDSSNCMTIDGMGTVILIDDMPWVFSINAEEADNMEMPAAGTYAITADLDTDETLWQICALVW